MPTDTSRGTIPAPPPPHPIWGAVRDYVIDDEPTPLNFYATRFAIIALGGMLAMWIWTL